MYVLFQTGIKKITNLRGSVGVKLIQISVKDKKKKKKKQR
jgi:hypothetical protein